MKYLTFSIMIYILLFNCSSDVDVQNAEIQPLLTDFLTLELSFGAENLPDEYLIHIPMGRGYRNVMTIDNENNIYLLNENRVKVYDENGNEKAIIGHPGQGPGEFSGSYQWLPTVGPEGYVSVFNNTFYNVYDPEYKFLKKIVNKKPRVSGTVYQLKVITIDENEYLGEITENHPKDDLLITEFAIEYSKNGEKTKIVSYDTPTRVVFERSHMSLSYVGDLFWDLVPDRRVLYTHSRIDEISKADGDFYVFHLYDLDSGERKKFDVPFTPVPLTKEELKTGGGYGMSGYGGHKEKLLKMRTDFWKKNNIKNNEAVSRVLFDWPIIYAVTNTFHQDYGYLTDVINGENGVYFRSFYMPIFPFILKIKNGYAYSITQNDEGFYVIEKYKIDAAVYGK